jgi:hypothetical protein
MTSTKAITFQKDPSSSPRLGQFSLQNPMAHLNNHRGILHNSDDYPEPDRFYPERYLDAEGKLDKSVRDPRTACYGFGRRICPGRFLADASLFMTVVTLLATVDIVRAKDDLGTEIIPKVEVSSGIISHPKPFPWAVRPRSGNVDAVLTSVGV